MKQISKPQLPFTFNHKEHYCHACLCTSYGCSCKGVTDRRMIMEKSGHYSHWTNDQIAGVLSILKNRLDFTVTHHSSREWYAEKNYPDSDDHYFQFGTFYGGHKIQYGVFDGSGARATDFMTGRFTPSSNPEFIAMFIGEMELEYRLSDEYTESVNSHME